MDAPLSVDMLRSVGQYIDEYLVELAGITIDRRYFGEGATDPDVILELVLQQHQGALLRLADIGVLIGGSV